MLSKLNNSYPYTSSPAKQSLKTVGLIGLFVFLFIFIFRADQMVAYTSLFEKLKIASYHGLIAFFIPMLNLIMVNIFIAGKDELYWKVKHEIGVYLLHFTGISIGNYFLQLVLNIAEPSILTFLRSVLMTLAVGAIPVSIYIISEQNKILKKNLESAQDLTGFDRSEEKEDETSIEVGEETIKIGALLYAESQRNYIKFTLTDGNKLTARMTMKSLEQLLVKYPQITRCHRAFFVNTHAVNKIDGNAQGLSLSLDNCETRIPVSRSYIPVIKEKFKQ